MQLKISTVSWFNMLIVDQRFQYSYNSAIRSNVKHKELFFSVVYPAQFFYVLFSFHRLAILAARALVVFDDFQICKICRSSTYHRDLH